MSEMIVCGFHMEMEMAKEMNYIGKCIGCLHLDGDGENEYCKGKVLKERKENCKDWLVDIR